jgi:hypothetical protein
LSYKKIRIESALDIASIGSSRSDIQQHGLTWASGLAPGADVVSLALPGVAAGGTLVRGLAHADEAVALLRGGGPGAAAPGGAGSLLRAGPDLAAARRASAGCSFRADTPIHSISRHHSRTNPQV